MTVTVQDMHDHVMALCAKHEVTVSWCRRPTQAWAAREIEEIQIAPIKSAISYSAAMHELGHILGRYQHSRNSMVRERWAWEWARRNALGWTPAMKRNERVSLAFAAKAEWMRPTRNCAHKHAIQAGRTEV